MEYLAILDHQSHFEVVSFTLSGEYNLALCVYQNSKQMLVILSWIDVKFEGLQHTIVVTVSNKNFPEERTSRRKGLWTGFCLKSP